MRRIVVTLVVALVAIAWAASIATATQPVPPVGVIAYTCEAPSYDGATECTWPEGGPPDWREDNTPDDEGRWGGFFLGRLGPSEGQDTQASYWIGSLVNPTLLIGASGVGTTTARATANGSTNTSARLATNSAAQSVVSGTKLNLRLASEQQMSEAGIPIIGAGTNRALLTQTSERLASQYGGVTEDWVKMTSSNYVARNGLTIETHWYENAANGLRVEPKTKFWWQSTGAG